MNKKKRTAALIVWLCLIALLLALIFIVGSPGGERESIRETMRDAVLHETNKISLLGITEVNPAVISGFTVTGTLLFLALLARIFLVPRMKEVPGKLQLLLEELVGFFDRLAKTNSPHRNTFLGAYIFAAGVYVFFGTVFELFGIQALTTAGVSIALPAPLADINGAISLGCLSYLVILGGGVVGDGLHGVGATLKDFSLPISMSFRLFGALLSGLLVTELVYYYIGLSFVLPVAVGVMFTILHALIQTYVLTMLTSLFYGEVSAKSIKKEKIKKKKIRRARA